MGPMILTAALAKGMDTMDQKMLRERIEKADWSLLKEVDSISDSEAAYLSTLNPASAESRELMVALAQDSNAKWGREMLFGMIKSKDEATRFQAGEALLDKVSPDDAKKPLDALRADRPHSGGDDEFTMHLVQATGNTGDGSAIEPLMVLQKKEKRPEASHAYHQALAKLKFPKETRKLDFAREHGSAGEKAIALRDLRYINQAEWLPKTIPLLMDEMVARHTSKGPATFRIRVCDEAIATLGTIDPAKKIPFEVSDIFGYPFSDDQLAQARRAYGLLK